MPTARPTPSPIFAPELKPPPELGDGGGGKLPGIPGIALGDGDGVGARAGFVKLTQSE